MFRAILTGIVAMLIAGGCAITPANLNVSYDAAKAKIGPLSSVKPLKVEVGTFADKRQVTNNIGYKRNTLGVNTAYVRTTRPVPEIIRDAIVTAFNKNGHTVTSGEGDKDIAISGSVETFWFESQVNFWTIEFMGTVDVNMAVQDGHTGQVLLNKRYSGHHNAALLSGYHKEMANTMNATMENLIDQISVDAKLIEVLSSYSTSHATSTTPTQSLN